MEDEENIPIREDKIINNSYNTGEMEFEAFSSEMRIDPRVSANYEDQLSDNLVEVRVVKELNKVIYSLFMESPFYEKYKNPKRVDKSDMVKMYYYFKEKLIKKNTYSSSQIFIGFAEFFQVNYDQLYGEIGVMDKEGLLRELNSERDIKKQVKSKKLF